MSGKPKFNPNESFEVLDGEKPKFDPNAPFEDVAQLEQNKNAMSPMTSAMRGLGQGASLGFADEGGGALEALYDIATTDKKLGDFNELYKKHRDESRATNKKATNDNPKSYGAGELGGAIGTAFIPGLAVAKGATAAATIGKGALQAGLASAGQTQNSLDSLAGLKDVVSGTAFGAGAGAVGIGIGKALGSGLSAAGNYAKKGASVASDIAESQAARAVGAERATIKALGKDKVKALGRSALDALDPETGKPIVSGFASTDEMIARNNALKKMGSDNMSDVYRQIDDAGASTFNPLDQAAKVEAKIGDFYRSPINRGETNQLENTLESILQRGDHNIPIGEAQKLKEELGKVANWRNKMSITDKEQMARDAYGVINKGIDDAADAGSTLLNKPGLKDQLRAGNKSYSDAKGLETLLENKHAREAGNKMFGLTDGLFGGASVGMAIPTSGASLLVGGAAVGAKKFGERYGNQLVARGANGLAKALEQAPQAFGKFQDVLTQAAQRGTQGLASTHFILQQTNPEYRKLTTEINEE